MGFKMKLFHEILKELRKEKDLTQDDLAKLVDKKRATISNWENGRRFPEQDSLVKLSEILNVTTDYLLGISEFKKGRIVTQEELKTFLPETVINNHKLEFLVDEKNLSPETKEEIFKLLQKHGYIK